MFKLFKKAKAKPNSNKTTQTNEADNQASKPRVEKLSFAQRLINTKNKLGNQVNKLLLGKDLLSDELIEELEVILLSSDIGVQTTDKVLTTLKDKASKTKLNNQEDLYQLLKESLSQLLLEAPALNIEKNSPFVMLVIGINGAGKTTTIGKLAKQFQSQGKSVMLAAGDTFRAAAVEQLKVWGQRNSVPVVAQKTGADAAAVIYDALSSATSKGIDVLIADTAGRLHTQQNLMAELAKIKRILAKANPDAPHETLLILDGNTGGNGLAQAREFHQSIGIDSIGITKLDGSAKGGMLFSICDELSLPIRYIGVGEGVDDLQHFEKKAFVEALF